LKIEQVNAGQLAEKNSAFVAFVVDPIHHYQTNEECRSWGYKAWFSKIALLGVMVRWDGSYGFVGGKVDDGESLIEAAIRECMEEVGHQPDASQLTLVCSHSMVDGAFEQNTHLYICKVSADELYDIRSKSVCSQHARVESAGFAAVHMTSTAPETLKKACWAGTALSELNVLLDSGMIAPAVVIENKKTL
jgi:ADP-ribose pyrophosphatase YjhB (NUDIX family)